MTTLRSSHRQLFAGLQLSGSRCLSTSFADMFRESVASVPVKGGEILVGHVVGQRRPRSSVSQFSIVDFGLKSEAPFAAGEVPGVSGLGDTVNRPLVALEDDFNEPAFDHERQTEMPAILASRYRALTSATSDSPQFLHGRLSGFKRGGATAKILGFDAFSRSLDQVSRCGRLFTILLAFDGHVKANRWTPGIAGYRRQSSRIILRRYPLFAYKLGRIQ
jgi:hypothetical protein